MGWEVTGREEVKPAREVVQRGEGSLWKRTQGMVSEPVVQKGTPQEGRGRDRCCCRAGVLLGSRTARPWCFQRAILHSSVTRLTSLLPRQEWSWSVSPPRHQLPAASLFLLSSQTCLLSLAAHFANAATISPVHSV